MLHATWNYGTPGSATNQLIPVADSSTDAGSTSETGSDGAAISANDFLTLLVTEMQNQDPTADTDPNEYINQLVNVNSLEQLISINQTLSGAVGTASPTGGAENSAGRAALPPSIAVGDSQGVVRPVPAAAPHSVEGNLDIPRASNAANGIAHALGGHL